MEMLELKESENAHLQEKIEYLEKSHN